MSQFPFQILEIEREPHLSIQKCKNYVYSGAYVFDHILHVLIV